MQDVDPDMDEIFREAADKYPLKTNAAEWEAIGQKLYRKENNHESGVAYKRKGAVLFLMLLITTGLITTQYFKTSKQVRPAVAKVEEKKLKSLPVKKAATIINNGEAVKQENRGTLSNLSKQVLKEEFCKDWKNGITANFNNSKVTLQKELVALSQSNKIHQYDDLSKIYLPEELSDDRLKNKSGMFFENDQVKLSGSIENLNAPANKNSVDLKNNWVAAKRGRFYLGAVVAPELTSVKFQPVKRMSFNLGVLMGYSLSDKIGFELGATFAHKYYYTDGKYTTPKSIRSDNSVILNVNAFSSITEMPLTLQYNIKNRKNTRFFASAGFVSYVMHKEHYNYTYEKNGRKKHSVTYDNKAADYWFSNAQIGFGYEHSVKKIANIIIEPYYRIPLKSVGISDLPITSIGINFALTKNLKN